MMELWPGGFHGADGQSGGGVEVDLHHVDHRDDPAKGYGCPPIVGGSTGGRWSCWSPIAVG
jgi:hypothetical protein